jgi:hypothetical protein
VGGAGGGTVARSHPDFSDEHNHKFKLLKERKLHRRPPSPLRIMAISDFSVLDINEKSATVDVDEKFKKNIQNPKFCWQSNCDSNYHFYHFTDVPLSNRPHESIYFLCCWYFYWVLFTYVA